MSSYVFTETRGYYGNLVQEHRESFGCFYECLAAFDPLVGRVTRLEMPPKTIRTPEEEAAYREARRAASRERNRRQRAEYPERLRMSKRVSHQRRRQNDPGYRVMENFQRQVRRSLAAAKGRCQRESAQEDIATATVPRTALSMTKGCVVAMSTDVTHSWNLSCSRQTQATVTTGTTGTQCALGLLISSSCQTPEEFPDDRLGVFRTSLLHGASRYRRRPGPAAPTATTPNRLAATALHANSLG